MDISEQQWSRIKKFFSDATAGSLRWSIPYQTVATINEDGSPHITPIGSLILKEDKQGFYIEAFSRHMPRNLQQDQRICILLVNMNIWFLAKSFMLGKFDHPWGVRLMGIVGKKREATPQEISDFRKKIKHMKIFKGPRLMFDDLNLKYGREVSFHSFEPIQMGPMRAIESI